MKYLLYAIAGVALGFAIAQRSTVVNETHMHYDYPQPTYPMTHTNPWTNPWAQPTIICSQDGITGTSTT